ncbi:hypothetical protein [Brevibacillus laterosporus]|uniref:hypothetical protein n=1 Tax=Brevibacillus laterosporus TaxID=1465 RepID=UPI00215CE5F5|nr:hypothetical protein [Brevibacillus laterosporus]MCR8994595.1 hypothetical protein [Brevibacillus laterosporus]
MKTNFGEYQHFKGDIWISKLDNTKEIQGTNIAFKSESHENGELRVLGYVIRKGEHWTYDHSKYYTLEDIVWSVLKSQGWHDEYCNELLWIE